MTVRERWSEEPELPRDLRRRLDELPRWLAARGVRFAYLFGSLTAGKGPGSHGRTAVAADDVDLAAWREGGPAWELRGPLCEFLGTERLDLVDLRLAGPVLRFGIVRDGRRIWARDAADADEFEQRVILEYLDTAYLRRVQMEYVAARAKA